MLLERDRTLDRLERAVGDAAAGRGSVALVMGEAGMSAGSGADADALYRVTRGNPFFVTEALAAPGDAVPVSVVEAVLARVGRLSAECRETLDQLSVIPWHVDLELAAALLASRIDAQARIRERGRRRRR